MIHFELPATSDVSLTIYDVIGREVASVISKRRMTAGHHQITFDGSNLSSGIYLYRMRAGDFVQTKKLKLVK